MDKVNGNICAIISFFFGSVTWFSANADLIFKGFTALASIATAIFAVRYYWYAAKEKKDSIRDRH